MTNLRELINTKIARIMTDSFGHSNNFATLSYALTASPPPLIKYAPARVDIRLCLWRSCSCSAMFKRACIALAYSQLSMLSAMGSLIVFCIYLIQFLLL